MSPAKIYTCSFGEVVKHIHFWVLPRLPEMPAHGFEMLEAMLKEKRWTCSEKDAADIARRVREEYYLLRNIL
jgi:hypothetical protein